MLKLLTLDSNIFISETKGNEEYSDKCSDIISRVGLDFLLVEPAVLLDKEFCKKAGITGAQYGIYSADSLYLQTALDSYSTLVSLDEKEFILKLKDKNLPIEIYHPKEFPY